MMLKHGDIGMGTRLFDQGQLHGLPRCIRRVDHAPYAMTALPGQMIPGPAALISSERNALADEPLNGPGSFFDHVSCNGFVTEARACDKRVPYVGFGRIFLRQNRGNSPLRPPAGAVQ